MSDLLEKLAGEGGVFFTVNGREGHELSALIERSSRQDEHLLH